MAPVFLDMSGLEGEGVAVGWSWVFISEEGLISVKDGILVTPRFLSVSYCAGERYSAGLC